VIRRRVIVTILVFCAAAFVPAVARSSSSKDCSSGRTAPATGTSAWPPGARVRVFALRADFSLEEAQHFLVPISSWDAVSKESGSEVRFVYEGLSDRVADCEMCLTIVRGSVYSPASGHLAMLRGWLDEQQHLLRAAIVIDYKISHAELFEDIVAHEFGHTLGLRDCPTCHKRTTLMLPLASSTKGNDMSGPSRCDLAAVATVYQQLRLRPKSIVPRAELAFQIIEDEGQEPEADDTPIVNARSEPVFTNPSSSAAADPLAELKAGAGEELLRKVIAKELAFREALKQYTFTRAVLLQTVGSSGQITGEYVRNSQFVIIDLGALLEKVTYHPPSTIREMKITKEDILDLAGVQLFGFAGTNLSRYDLELAGSEIIEGRKTYVLNVRPRRPPDPQKMKERFFVGRLWVDADTYSILRLRGVAQPQGKQRFPCFETRRAQIDDRFWFPAETTADDILHFPSKAVHYRILVRYSNFRRFSSTVRVAALDDTLPPAKKSLR
jgi:hypothetical protein